MAGEKRSLVGWEECTRLYNQRKNQSCKNRNMGPNQSIKPIHLDSPNLDGDFGTHIYQHKQT